MSARETSAEEVDVRVSPRVMRGSVSGDRGPEGEAAFLKMRNRAETAEIPELEAPEKMNR